MSAVRQTPEFQKYQFSFTGHIRNPKENPRPKGVRARRMAVYNDLLFNNISSLVTPCFPVAQSILGARKWKVLMREFMSTHHCSTPFFRQLPEEFLKFMQERGSVQGEPDFLLFLLHYEWIELSLEVSDGQPDWSNIEPRGDLRTGRPALTPVHVLLTYPYAVHRIGKRFQPTPDQREETRLLVFRDSNDKVQFVVLNPVTARLLSLIEQGNMTGDDAVERVVSEIQHPEPSVAREGGHAILENLSQQDAILGTFRADVSTDI